MYIYIYYVLLWLLLWIIPIILFQWGVMTILSVQHVFLQPSNSSNHLFAVHHDSTAVLRKPVQPFSFLQMPRLSVEWSFQAWWCIGVMRLQKTKHYRHKQPDNIYIYIYIYMQSAKSSEAAVIMVHLLLLVHDPQKGQAVSQSNLAQIWPSGHSRWNRKKYVNCKRFDIAVELKGCYLERASHVIVGISRHPWRCDCPRQSRQGMFARIASYTSMGA